MAKVAISRKPAKKAPATLNRPRSLSDDKAKISIKNVKLPKVSKTSPNKTQSEANKFPKEDVLETSGQFIRLLREHIENARDKSGAHLYQAEGMSKIAAFCQKHDFEYAYIIALLNGTRWLPRSGKEVACKFAKIFKVSTIQIYNYCGFFDASDVIATVDAQTLLDIAYQRLIRDPLMGVIAPSEKEWMSWPENAKTRFILLYELAAQKILLNHAKAEFSEKELKKLNYGLVS